MKKFLLIVFLCTLFTLPAFSAAWQIQEARNYYTKGQYEQALSSINSAINSSSSNDPEAYKLRLNIYMKLGSEKYLNEELNDVNTLLKLTNNKALYDARGHINLQLGNYEQAYKDFCSSLDKNNAKSTITANTGFITIAQDVKAPISIRISALDMIAYIYKVNDKTNDALAAVMKMVQLIALLPENDPIWANKNMSKEDGLNNLRNSFKEKLAQGNALAVEFYEGLFKYAIGNKELGEKIINGVINECASRYGTTQANELRSMFNYVKKALDNGLPNNTL